MDEHIRTEMMEFKGQKPVASFRLDTRLAVNALKDLCRNAPRGTTDYYCLLDGKYTEYIGAVNRDGLIEYVVPLPRGKAETPTFTGGLEEYENLCRERCAAVRKGKIAWVVMLLALLGVGALWFIARGCI